MTGFKLSAKFLSVGLFLFFVLPYVLFFKAFTLQIQINFSELLWALKNSFIQASTASLVCACGGLFLSFGVLQFPKRIQHVILKLLLLPQIVPSLFSILIAFSLIKSFPMGHAGVIFIFILVNLGFSTFQFYYAIQEKVGQFALISDIFGINRLKFYRKILFPLVWPDVKLNFMFVFLFCISSLSIPLVAGGGKGTNLEVLIYEKIFIDQNWSTAWFLMILQSGLVFSLSFLFLKSRSYQVKEFVAHKFLKSKVAAVAVGAYLLVYLGGYFYHLAQSLQAIEFMSDYLKEIVSSTISTMAIIAVVLLISYGVFLVWLTDYVQRLKHNFAIHLISVSTILVGFAFYLFFPQTVQFDFIKIPLAFTILFFPSLFRLLFEKRINQIKNQILVAKIFGLTKQKIIFEVILKQIKRPLFLAVSLLTIWSLGDFAILRSLGSQTSTLGLLTQGFLTSYRLEAAFLLSFYILIIWFVLSGIAYFFIEGFHVDHKKH